MKRQRGGRIDIVDLLYMCIGRRQKQHGEKRVDCCWRVKVPPSIFIDSDGFSALQSDREKKVSDSPVYIAEPIMLT